MPAYRLSSATQFRLLTITLMFLAACSGSNEVNVPSAAEAENQFSERIAAESEGRARLVSFQQTDGRQAEAIGVSFFRLTFEGQIEFTEDCKWLRESDGLMFQTRKPPTGDATQGWGKHFEDYKYPGVMVKKGQREKVAGTLVFSKTDKAWSAPTFER